MVRCFGPSKIKMRPGTKLTKKLLFTPSHDLLGIRTQFRMTYFCPSNNGAGPQGHRSPSSIYFFAAWFIQKCEEQGAIQEKCHLIDTCPTQNSNPAAQDFINSSQRCAAPQGHESHSPSPRLLLGSFKM
jgi:hypothetical protein